MPFREPLKPDHRPKRLGWAPGDYFCMCAQCGAHYLGDKRSWTCAPCAYAEAETAGEMAEVMLDVAKTSLRLLAADLDAVNGQA